MVQIKYLSAILIFAILIVSLTYADELGNTIEHTYIYAQETIKIPIYGNETITEKDNCKIGNLSCIPFTNTFDRIIITGYEYIQIETKNRIGISIGGKNYTGYYNLVNDKITKWEVPIGDRNMKEFGRCRQYELDKGICNEDVTL